LSGIGVLVEATAANFDERCYTLANPDVAAAKHDPASHFKDFGAREGRLQVNPELLKAAGYRSRKFLRFRNILRLPLSGKMAFPIVAGPNHFSIDQYSSESANGDFDPFIQTILDNPTKLYMDLGCGLRKTVYDNCLYVDVYPSVAADLIVEPSCIYPIADNSLDGVGCFAVLEHTRKPWLVAQEIFRMLKPGGRIWVDWPFLQPVHGFPSHYYNSTREGLKAIFEDIGFSVESCFTMGFQGPDHTVNWVLSGLLGRLSEERRERVLGMPVRELLQHRPESPFWRDLLEGVDDGAISEFSCGNTLYAVKR
jgi:SAM-dependent methyltransferase